MSGQVSDRAAARIERRGSFVHLTPWGTIDVLNLGDAPSTGGLPVMELSVQGLPEYEAVAVEIVETLRQLLADGETGLRLQLRRNG